MNKEALLRVADILDRVPQGAFHLDTFFGYNNTDIEYEDVSNTSITDLRYSDTERYRKIEKLLDSDPTVMIPHRCEATACACGYAGLDSWFRERGFRTEITGHVTYMGLSNFYAVVEFFKIPHNDADYLFAPTEYPDDYLTDPDYVAQRIRAYVAADGIPNRD